MNGPLLRMVRGTVYIGGTEVTTGDWNRGEAELKLASIMIIIIVNLPLAELLLGEAFTRHTTSSL